MTTLIWQKYFPRHGISGERFQPWSEPIAIIEKGVPGILEHILEVRCADERKPADDLSVPKWEVTRLDDGIGLSVTATEGCAIGWKVKRSDEDGYRIMGDASLFMPGNLWDDEPDGFILSAYLGRPVGALLAAAVLLLAQDGARALPTTERGNVVQVQGYPYPRPSREEMDWRRRHPEIPGYAPYTPGYGPYIDENGLSRWQGTPNPYYREEYAPVEYPRVLRCWRDPRCR